MTALFTETLSVKATTLSKSSDVMTGPRAGSADCAGGRRRHCLCDVVRSGHIDCKAKKGAGNDAVRVERV